MASGNSRRFDGNKLLCDFMGKKLYLHTLEMLYNLTETEENCDLRVISQHKEILDKAEQMGIKAVESPESKLGASYTVKNAVKSIDNLSQEDYLIFVVADQPFLTRESVKKLLDTAGKGLVARLYYNETAGNPVMFSAQLADSLLKLEGDKGGGAVAKKYPCEKVFVSNEKELIDIDTLEDLNNVKKAYT